MEQATDRREVRLAGVPLGKARHICALFHDRDEWFEVLLPFVREGLQVGDNGVWMVTPLSWAGYRCSYACFNLLRSPSAPDPRLL